MENLKRIQKYHSVESFAPHQTEQFLKPRTFLDKIFLLVLFIWWISSVIFQENAIFRASLFFVAIGLFVVIPLYIFIREDQSSSSSLNRAVKILIFYVLILRLTSKEPVLEFWDVSFPITFRETERTIVSILIPLVILGKSLSPETLKLGYIFYIGGILQGFWKAILVLFVFKGINLYHPVSIIPIDIELLLLLAYVAFLLGNLLPGIPPLRLLSISSLFEQFMALKSRTERFRDALFFSGITLLIFLLLDWLVIYRDLFQYLAFIDLVVGFLWILAPKKPAEQRLSSLLGSISDQTIDPTSQLGNRVQNFAKTVREIEFQKPEKVYTIPKDGMKVISKGKTTLTASQGSIIVPSVTPKGTALVLMGESEMETETEGEDTIKTEIRGPISLWMPPEEWKSITAQLVPKELVDLSKAELMVVGLNSLTEIFEVAKSALNDLKSWKGPRKLFYSVLDPSKYAITETKEYTMVRFPGIYVFESSEIELVQILGGLAKVIEIKGIVVYVQILGGLLTVMETTDYSFVQLPFLTVLETPHGQIVNILGFQIQEGERIDLTKTQERIIEDLQNYDSLFAKRIESLFQKDPQLILTESKGRKLEFIVGEDEVLGDTQRKLIKKHWLPKRE